MNDERPMMSFDPEKLKRLKAAYESSKGEPSRVFQFEGHAYVVAYAKYLIEFLEGEFERDGVEAHVRCQ